MIDMDNELKIKMTNKKRTTSIIVGVVIIALILAGAWTFRTTNEALNSDLEVQGSVKTTDISLNSKLAGNIAEVLVHEGDRVKAGDVIIRINSEAVEAKKQQAEAAKAAAAAQANKAANGARAQEVAQAKAAYDYATKMYNRMAVLVKEEAISQAQFDEIEAKYIAARETYNMALEGARSEDVAAAGALVAQADGAIAEVDSYLEDSEIKAPADGIITAVNVNAGELISTGMPLATLTTDDKPWVEVNVDETDLDKISEGMTVQVTFPAYQEKAYTGKVTVVNKKADFATKKATNMNGDFDIISYGVKVELQDVDKPLYSGMTAVVNFSKNK